MRIKRTPDGTIPVFTREEKALMRKAARLMDRVADKLELSELGDPANDDMVPRARMVSMDFEEFDTALGDAGG